MSSSKNTHWHHDDPIIQQVRTSLTSRSDLKEKKLVSNKNMPDLDNEQVTIASNELIDTSYVHKFPRIEKLHVDPPIDGQNYCILSYIPAKTAVPDADGVYGMMKMRGVFKTEDEAVTHAENLIKNTDSFHRYFISYVGHSVPITCDPKYSSEHTQVEIKNKQTEVTSDSIFEKKYDEKKEMKEIQDRANKLNETVTQEFEDPELLYQSKRYKRSHLAYAISEGQKKIHEYQSLLKNAIKELDELDNKDPRMKDLFIERYYAAREASKIPATDASFIAYLGDELPDSVWNGYTEEYTQPKILDTIQAEIDIPTRVKTSEDE